eukprot:EG_transcript_1479
MLGSFQASASGSLQQDVAVSSATFRGLPLATEDPVRRYHRTLLAADPAEYLLDFEDEAQRAAVVVSGIPVQEMEAARAEALVQERAEWVAVEQQHWEEVRLLTQRLKGTAQDVDAEADAYEEEETARLREVSELPRRAEREMGQWFHAAQQRVRLFVVARQRALRRLLGRPTLQAEPVPAGPRPAVRWAALPQPVEIRVQALRGVKDKLPPNVYILLISKWNKLGGETLRWCDADLDSPDAPACPLHDPLKGNPEYRPLREACEICRGWVCATQPRWHDATYRSQELVFNTACQGLFPPQTTIQPYMALVLEVVRVPLQYAAALNLPCVPPQRRRRANLLDVARGRGVESGVARGTVAWGCFPVANNRFQVARGKFKLPLLRGEVAPAIRHFRQYQRELAAELEHWGGNLYFDIVPLPRTHQGVEEFVAGQESSRTLLGLQESEGAYWELDDPNNWVVARRAMLDQDFRRRSSAGLPALPRTAHGARRAAQHPLIERPDDNLLHSDSDLGTESSTFDVEVEDDDASVDLASEAAASPLKPRSHGMWMPAEVRRRLDGRRQDPGRQHFGDAGDAETQELLAEVRAFNERRQQEAHRVTDRSDKWRRYRYSFGRDGTFGDEAGKFWVQSQFVWRAMVDELSVRHPLSWTFAACVVAFFFVAWVQMWIRDFGLYIGLNIIGVPITRVVVKFTGLLSQYTPLYMWAFDEVTVVVIAHCGLHLVALCLIGGGWLFSRAQVAYPQFLSKVLYLYHLATYILLFTTIISDEIQGLEDSDIYRLLRFYRAKSYPELFAYFTVVVLYLLTQTLHCYTLYLYTMYVHLGGILIDVYHRTNDLTEAEVDQTFMPGDFEVSWPELQFILDRAERWRGANGERRKTLAEEIITTDAEDPDFYEVQVRIAIYTLDAPDPSRPGPQPRTLFREFYALSHGAIIEAIDFRQTPPVFDQTQAATPLLRGRPAEAEWDRGGLRQRHGRPTTSPSLPTRW